MPSNQLAVICEHIEKQTTDHFGKFYMYVALLNTVTVRDKTFTDSLPKYSGFFDTIPLRVGEIPTELTKQLTHYAREFINPRPDLTNTLYNIVPAYFRKGKISDLIYIIDQMLYHLDSIYGVQYYNQSIYEDIGFADKKGRLTAFISQVSMLNRNLLSLLDNVGNTGFSLLAAITGGVLILASVFSLIPTIIGLGLVLGGGCAASDFVNQVSEQAKQLEEQMKEVVQKINQLPYDESLWGDENHKAFYGAVTKTMPYVVITAGEQLMFEDSHQTDLAAKRQMLDLVCTF